MSLRPRSPSDPRLASCAPPRLALTTAFVASPPVIAVCELAERFSYYGCAVVFVSVHALPAVTPRR